MPMDDDIKIAPASFAGNRPAVDSGEEAARQFLEQKECGNIDKARALGKAYAGDVIGVESAPQQERTQRELHHQIVLYSYIVNRVIAEHSPNSIVAQTCLNVFYSEIEAASEELRKHVSDMAAFSLYVLCERSPNRGDDEMGLIYAELCDFDGNQDKINDGNAFYQRVYKLCAEKIAAAEFVKA